MVRTLQDNESYLQIKPESENKAEFYPARMYFLQKVVWDDLEEDLAIGGATKVPYQAPQAVAAQPRSFPAPSQPAGTKTSTSQVWQFSPFWTF